MTSGGAGKGAPSSGPGMPILLEEATPGEASLSLAISPSPPLGHCWGGQTPVAFSKVSSLPWP